MSLDQDMERLMFRFVNFFFFFRFIRDSTMRLDRYSLESGCDTGVGRKWRVDPTSDTWEREECPRGPTTVSGVSVVWGIW